MTTLLFFMYYYQSKPTTAKKKTKHIHINKKTDVEYFCLEEVNEGEDLVILRCGVWRARVSQERHSPLDQKVSILPNMQGCHWGRLVLLAFPSTQRTR